MTDKIVMVEKLRSMVIKPSRIDYETYFKAKELLKIYKDVLWNIEEGIEELDKQSRELLGEDLAFAVEILDKFDYRMNKEKLDDKLLDASEIKIMVELIAHALIKVKNYPRNGERYFDILQLNFLLKYTYSEDELLMRFDISKSTYYRQRKDAIKLFGYCLWDMLFIDTMIMKQKRY